MTIIVRDIGYASDREIKHELGNKILPEGTRLYFAEISINGRRETMYFDVIESEVKDLEELKQWVIAEVSKPHIIRYTSP